MFERFTDRARRVVVLAQEQSRAMRHNYIGTEHLLLALLAEHEGIAARALTALGVTEERTRAAIVARVPAGTKDQAGHIPFTPRAKKVLELSLREALALHHNYIGTEHIVLGLLREGEGVGAKTLDELGVDMPRLRQQVMGLVGVAGLAAAGGPGVSLPAVSRPVELAVEQARGLAGEESVSSHQLVLALLADPDSAARRALGAAGVDIDAAVRALRAASVIGSSDESDQDRGRRGLRLRLDGTALHLDCTDPTLLELAGTAGLPADGLAGDSDAGAPLGGVWGALHQALSALNAAATVPPAAPARRGRAPRGRRTPRS